MDEINVVSLFEIIKFVLGSGGLIGVIVIVFRFGKVFEKLESMDRKFDAIDKKFDAVEKRFDKIDEKFDKIDQRFNHIDKTLAEHGERLAFLEAANIYTMPVEPVIPNARSSAAAEMWRKRRSKKLEHKN